MYKLLHQRVSTYHVELWVPSKVAGRAFVLAARTRLKKPPSYETIRIQEVDYIRALMKTQQRSQYIVVTGPKGVGKSILLDTVLRCTAGVIPTTVPPGQKTEKIVLSTLLQITGTHPSFFSPETSAKRILFCYRYLQYLPYLLFGITMVTASSGIYFYYIGSSYTTYWFGLAGVSLVAALLLDRLSPGTAPIVVMCANERNSGENCASITGAVRQLRDRFRVNVIVDGSPNSLDDSLFCTTRECVYYVQPFSRENIMKLPQFNGLPSEVRNDAVFCDIIWEVMGGIPSKYDQLLSYSNMYEDKCQGIKEVLLKELQRSDKTIQDAISSNPDMVKILELLKFENSNPIPIPYRELNKRNLQRSSLDKVLRRDDQYLYPATNAISLILRYKLEKMPTCWEELKSLLGK